MIYSLLGYNKHGKFDKMLLKVVILLLAVIISGKGNTSMAESSDADS